MRRRSSNPLPRSLPKRGYAVKPGTNPVAYGLGVYATPEFAARHAQPEWTIVNLETGETVGVASDFL